MSWSVTVVNPNGRVVLDMPDNVQSLRGFIDPKLMEAYAFRALGYKHNVWPMQTLAELRPRWWSPKLTPLVSAIGHENDRPLLDEVADLRASTPTDAAKRVVPDVGDELARVQQARARLRGEDEDFGEIEVIEEFEEFEISDEESDATVFGRGGRPNSAGRRSRR